MISLIFLELNQTEIVDKFANAVHYLFKSPFWWNFWVDEPEQSNVVQVDKLNFLFLFQIWEFAE